jgi:hypothetical protein
VVIHVPINYKLVSIIIIGYTDVLLSIIGIQCLLFIAGSSGVAARCSGLPGGPAGLRGENSMGLVDEAPMKITTVDGAYPLVNIQKAIENGHRNSGYSH